MRDFRARRKQYPKNSSPTSVTVLADKGKEREAGAPLSPRGEGGGKEKRREPLQPAFASRSRVRGEKKAKGRCRCLRSEEKGGPLSLVSKGDKSENAVGANEGENASGGFPERKIALRHKCIGHSAFAGEKKGRTWRMQWRPERKVHRRQIPPEKRGKNLEQSSPWPLSPRQAKGKPAGVVFGHQGREKN